MSPLLRLVLHATLFQLLWFACVMGNNLVAIASLLFFFAAYQQWTGKLQHEWKTILAITITGFSSDLILAASGAIQFTHSDTPPLWLLALWAGFATMPLHALRWLGNFPVWLQAITGAFIAPLTYWCGITLGGKMMVNNTAFFILGYAATWAILMPLFYLVAKRLRQLPAVPASTVPLLGLSLLLSLLPAKSEADSDFYLHLVGDAIDLESSKPLYREIHKINGIDHTIVYRSINDTLIADKKLSYHKGYNTPEFTLRDYRFDRNFGSTPTAQGWQLWKIDKNSDREETNVSNSKELVIDAGFNGFIIDHFEELNQGKTIAFEFGITNPPMTIAMKMQPQSCKLPVYQAAGDTRLCLKVTGRHAIVSWFVPDIYLAFTGEAPALVLALYQGPSNLDSDDDDRQNVRIVYRQTDDRQEEKP